MVVLYRLGTFLELPFIDTEGFVSQFGKYAQHNVQERFSIFLLGIMPYVSAYICVELLSLCIPFLKKMRSGGFRGRQKLKRISLTLALLFASIQAIGLVKGFKELTLKNGESIVNISNSFEYMMLICLMVLGVYILIVLCELISKYGIGHGISIVLLSGICGDFFQGLSVHFHKLEYYEYALFPYVLAALAFLTLASFSYVLLKTRVPIHFYHKSNKILVDYFQLNLAPSSLAAITYASSIIMLPMFFETGETPADIFHPGSIWYNSLSVCWIFTFSCLFGWAFLHPGQRIKKMRDAGWHMGGTYANAEKTLLKKQFIYNLPWTLFLCLMVILPSTLITSVNVPFYVGGSSIPIIVAIFLDLFNEFDFYQKHLSQPVKVAELHDVYDANMIQNHLKATGINSFLQGYHHRLLRYIFGPHIEMSLVVDEQDKEQVQKLIHEYYGGNGLC